MDEDNLMELSVQDHQVVDEGIWLDLGSHEGHIHLFSDNLARVSIVDPDEEVEESRGVANGLDEWDSPSFSVSDNGDHISIDTETITVEVNKDLFGVTFLDEDGNVINEDYTENGSAGYSPSTEREVPDPSPSEGLPYAYKKADEDEAFYGFGEQPEPTLNQRGKKLENWNTDQYGYGPDSDYVYSSIPFFVGLKDAGAYGIFFDNTHHTVFHTPEDPDASGSSYDTEAGEDYYYFVGDGGQMTYYFANGPEISDVLDRYTDLTGTTPLPPKWSLGLHQSKWEYTPEETVEVPKRYREEEIPLDVMHFDIQYMNNYRVFTINEGNREALQTLTEDMPELKTVVVNDPGVAVDEEIDVDGDGDIEEYEPYTTGNEQDVWTRDGSGDDFVGPVWPGNAPEPYTTGAKWPDFSQPHVRTWWAEMHDMFFDLGFDGLKNDMGEPAVFSGQDVYDWTMPVDNQHGPDDEGDMMLHEEYHNVYGFDYARASREAYDLFKPDQRPFLLNRNLFAGGQRIAAIWTGDNVSVWEHLQMQLPMMMNLGLSGMAFNGHDVGGFSQRPEPELFKRWIAMGAFTPFYRNHTDTHRNNRESEAGQGGTHDSPQPRNQHPWTYGEEGIEITKKYTELRYQLMPYLYNEFEESSENGKPVFQPLVYQYQDDPEVRNITDEFLFGDNVLIAPVVEQGATERDVYFPAGDRWVDFWTNEIHEGGQWKTVDAPIDHLPIYVRKDEIVPMREVQQYTGQRPLTTLELRTYLDDEASYSFYEDDGETRAFQDGEYNVTHFTVSANNGGVVTFERELGVQNYAGSELSSYLLNLDRSEAPRKVQAASSKYEKVDADDVEDTPESYAYDPEQDAVLVHIPAGEDRKVQLFFNGQGRGNAGGNGRGRGQ
nr:TIM-barrel domain-containing protein [Halomicroarcula amylolytica]